MAEMNTAAKYSKDCKSWNAVDASNQTNESGFIKVGEQYIFFDFKKKFWTQIGDHGPIFYKRGGHMNILMGSELISHPMNYKSEDIIADVIMALAESGKEIARKESRQWRLRSKDGKADMTYFLAPSEKCTFAPEARFISCRNDKCTMGPRVANSESISKLCIKQLKLMKLENTQNLNEVCKAFGDEKVYKLLAEENQKANHACGHFGSKLLSQQEVRAACNSALQNIKTLQ